MLRAHHSRNPAIKLLATAVMFVWGPLCVSSAANAQSATRHISLRSTYLANPIERFRQLSITGDLSDSAGRGTLELNPNACTLNDFGDTDLCTEIALTIRSVQLLRTRTSDPLGLNRQLWVITGTALDGVLFLTVPESHTGPYRLIYSDRSGASTVIAMEPLVYYQDAEKRRQKTVAAGHGKAKCVELARKVDSVEATAEVHAGFANGTYFLTMQGRKPHANTWVEISPVTYVRRPEYWQIDVKECHVGDILLPMVMPFVINEEITHAMGTKGIELRWANGDVQKIDKP